MDDRMWTCANMDADMPGYTYHMTTSVSFINVPTLQIVEEGSMITLIIINILGNDNTVFVMDSFCDPLPHF